MYFLYGRGQLTIMIMISIEPEEAKKQNQQPRQT